jgi:hypothetical protein
VSFVPRFPFLAGNRYAVLVHRSLDDDGADRPGAGAGAGGTFDLDDYAQLSIRAPIRARAPSTRVVAITPSAGAVPRNLLRCYVEFSAPMSEGEAADHVALVDRDTQVPVAGALLALDPELWDPARRRLTVLLDPARIKRGLVPHREAGYALHEGARVELVVDRQFRDADGQPLVGEARRAYVVGPDVRARIDAGRWAIGRPAAGGREALTVDFGRVLDRALLDHCVVVVDDAGRALDGSATVANGETSWTFTPAEPWSAVRHAVVIDAMLEDVAGNSVVRVFDRDLADDSHTPTPGGHVTVEFTPEPARR